MNIDVKAIGERVRELREARGWSQDELAAKAGIAQTTVSRIERGVTAKPTLADLSALAASLGVAVEELTPAEATAETEKTAHSTTETEAATPAKTERVDAREVSERIVGRALVLGISLRQMARQAGLGESQVLAVVTKGRRKPDYEPDVDILRKIARGAECSFEWLLTGEGEVAPEHETTPPSRFDALTAAEALRIVETIEPQLLRALVRMRPAARDALLAMLEAL